MLLVVFWQAEGAIIAQPIMSDGIDPVTTSAIMVGTATLFLIFVGFISNPLFCSKKTFTLKLIVMTIINGYLAMGVGMTLLLYGLVLGDAGVVTILSATTPVLILPLLWITTSIRPPLMAWVGTVVILVGIAFITFAWN